MSAVTGAMVYVYLQQYLLKIAAEPWFGALPAVVRVPLSQPSFLLGVIFILFILFAPGGSAAPGRPSERPRRNTGRPKENSLSSPTDATRRRGGAGQGAGGEGRPHAPSAARGGRTGLRRPRLSRRVHRQDHRGGGRLAGDVLPVLLGQAGNLRRARGRSEHPDPPRDVRGLGQGRNADGDGTARVRGVLPVHRRAPGPLPGDPAGRVRVAADAPAALRASGRGVRVGAPARQRRGRDRDRGSGRHRLGADGGRRDDRHALDPVGGHPGSAGRRVQ